MGRQSLFRHGTQGPGSLAALDVVQRNWTTAGPKLVVEVHIVVGDMENYSEELDDAQTMSWPIDTVVLGERQRAFPPRRGGASMRANRVEAMHLDRWREPSGGRVT